MPNRQSITDTKNLIDSIPKILFWTWGSLFLGIITTFAITISLGKTTGFQTRIMPTLLGTQTANARVRGGGRNIRPSDTRPEVVVQERNILRAAAQNE